jgi:hypothetical protein
MLCLLMVVLGGRHTTNELFQTRQLDRDSRNGDGRRRLVRNTLEGWPDKSSPERVL